MTSSGDQAWANWQASVETDSDLGEDFLAQFKRVIDASDFVAQQVLRQPQWLLELAKQGVLGRRLEAAELRQQLQEQLTNVTDEATLQVVLRHYRNRQMLRIIWRDICQLANLAETLEDLSELADCCISEALERLYCWGIEKTGKPRDESGVEQKLLVLGMGKLGARELNLSSDIDLIFIYPAQGETDGQRVIDNEQFFTRLGQKLINCLSKMTADGFVFRVDMRLRPFGDSGRLVMTFLAAENYYQSQAREWERYAMVKARVLTGNKDDVATLKDILRPFVYRRYIDFGVIEAIREMKSKIEKEMHHKGMDANIKLGKGGIREIEFIGQAFQLVRGGRQPDLQVRPILQVLQVLHESELLPPSALPELTQAYEFLRLTENRIQAWKDEQTHLLPEDEDGRARIARAMNYSGWQAFEHALAQHREKVSRYFQQVFAAPQLEDNQGEEAASILIWSGQHEAQVETLLVEMGYQETLEVHRQLSNFRDAASVQTLSVRGRDRLNHLMPLLLDAVSQRNNPDLTLSRLLALLYAIVKRTAYLNLLLENPLALSQLVQLGSESAWVVSQLTRHPLLLDELLDPRRLYAPLNAEQLESELSVILKTVDVDDLEQQMDRMRQFADGARLRVAAADIAEVIPVRVVSDYLTEIAETVLAHAATITLDSMVAKHGWPTQVAGKEGAFAIIAYGKLGGTELGYSSDLDLLFLHGSNNVNAMTDGAKALANDVFYARLGQRIINFMTTRTASGQLYEIDMRLRPNGNSGMLVSSLTAFEKYQFEKAWIWEHQALVRARAVAGDPEVMAEFERVRQVVLRQKRDPERLRQEVVNMRTRMRESMDRSNKQYFDIKQGAGGIADIEFMVQYAVLRWGCQYSDLLNRTGNIRLLEVMAKLGILEGNSAELLSDAYQVYRAIYHRNALKESSGLVPAEMLVKERTMVIKIWQKLLLEKLHANDGRS